MRAPVRVLLIAPTLEIVGGQSVQAQHLREAFIGSSEVSLAFQPANAALPGALAALRKVKFVRTAAAETVYFGALARRVPRFDVVHAFVAGYWSFYLTLTPLLWAAKRARVPVVVHYHDGRAEDHFRRFPHALAMARRADELVVPSQFLVDVFGQFGLRARAISNIVDTSRFRYRERTTIGPVILHNRGFETHYNVACTLRAFAAIQREKPEAKLTLAHDGPLRGELERQAAELRLRNVSFTGRVSQERMSALYDEADIYMTSPDADNMPLSVLEAFASGVPVVATAAGGVPYLIEHERTGLLAAPNDDAGLARAALRLMEFPELARTLAANGQRECSRYSSQAVGQEWTALYGELSGRRRA